MSDQDKFLEHAPHALSLLESADNEPKIGPDGPWPIEGIGLNADVINANGRRYSSKVVMEAVERLQDRLSNGGADGRVLLGEVEHPGFLRDFRPTFDHVVVNWTDVQFAEGKVKLRGLLLGTQKGKDMRAAMMGGVVPGISARGYGTSEEKTETVDGEEVTFTEVTYVDWPAFDITVDPADVQAGITHFERKQRKMETNDPVTEKPKGVDVSALTVEELRKLNPGLVESLVQKAEQEKEAQFQEEQRRREAEAAQRARIAQEALSDYAEAVGAGETDDPKHVLEQKMARLRALEEKERRAKVKAYVEGTVGELAYDAKTKEKLIDSVMKEEPETEEQARHLIVSRREIIDDMVTRDKLSKMGYGRGTSFGATSVFESETGMPEYLRASWEILQRLIERNKVASWDQRNPANVNQSYAARYLDHFDDGNKGKLVRETERFLEAMTVASDVTLPTSVVRAVIAGAVPQLMTTSIFDFGFISNSPTQLFYSTYAPDYTVGSFAASGEAVNVTALDTWLSLSNKSLKVGTVVIASCTGNLTIDGGTTAGDFDEHIDYVVDYEGGRIKFIDQNSAGVGVELGSSPNGVTVNYTYHPFRKGEGQPIERAKLQTVPVTISVEADRLATQITDEVITFSTTQLGWDALADTLSSLITELRIRIDERVVQLALSAAGSVPGNVGGTWTSGGDLSLLGQYIGAAKVKVANRYWTPTFVLMSLGNSDLLSDSDQFTAAGARSDSSLNPNGYVGRVRGLDAFETTSMPDSKILVGARDLVMHRVLIGKTMSIKGPVQAMYSDGDAGVTQIVAASDYYVEEYNGSWAPIEEAGTTDGDGNLVSKGSLVLIS